MVTSLLLTWNLEPESGIGDQRKVSEQENFRQDATLKFFCRNSVAHEGQGGWVQGYLMLNTFRVSVEFHPYLP